MVVDDEMHIRTALARELRSSHYNIIRAETGNTALSKLEKQPVELIIVDIRMPVMDGVEFIQKVTSLYQSCHIIVLSGTVTKQVMDALKPYLSRIYRIFTKPWDSDQLLEAIREVFEFEDMDSALDL